VVQNRTVQKHTVKNNNGTCGWLKPMMSGRRGAHALHAGYTHARIPHGFPPCIKHQKNPRLPLILGAGIVF